MTDQKLLPCPFCGSNAEIYSATERRPDHDGTLQGHWVVDCTVCNANIEFLHSPEHAATEWNTRAQVNDGFNTGSALNQSDHLPGPTKMVDSNHIADVNKMVPDNLPGWEEWVERMDMVIRKHHPQLQGKRAYAGEIGVMAGIPELLAELHARRAPMYRVNEDGSFEVLRTETEQQLIAERARLRQALARISDADTYIGRNGKAIGLCAQIANDALNPRVQIEHKTAGDAGDKS